MVMNNGMITIKAVGDICPGDKAIPGLGVMSKCKAKGPMFMFEGAAKHLSEVDILIGNLEGMLTERIYSEDAARLTFCGLPEFAQAMADTGFNVINIANNHTLEHGPEVFIETVGHLEKSGINVCGLRDETLKYHSKPVIVQIKGKRVGLIGYNWVGTKKFVSADNYIAQAHDSVVNYTWDRSPDKNKKLQLAIDEKNSLVLKDLHLLKAEVDIVILLAHWGYEYVNYPPYGVTLEARKFVRAGADLIIGCHPHVLQGMEAYDGKMIFYSLGNFIFDARDWELKRSAILKIKIGGKGSASYDFMPFYINNSFQPVPAGKSRAKAILKLISNSNQKIISSKKEDMLEDEGVYRRYEKRYRIRKKRTILNHLIALFEDPRVIKIILRKVATFYNIVTENLKGKKVRW
jgi:poly-gamma-glutamate synthesis protein (capsule biosynthesis protein)